MYSYTRMHSQVSGVVLAAEWGDFTAEMYGAASSASSQIRSTYASLCLSNVPALGSGAAHQAGTSGGTLQSPQFDTLIEKIVAYHKMHAYARARHSHTLAYDTLTARSPSERKGSCCTRARTLTPAPLCSLPTLAWRTHSE